MNKLTPFAKILIAAIVVVGLWFGFAWARKSGLLDKIAPPSAQDMASMGSAGLKSGGGAGVLGRPLRIGINTWCGFAGVVYWNKGMKPSASSRFYTDDGLQVEILQIDDMMAGKESWKAGKIDVWYCTVDSFPVDISGIKSQMPKIVLQTDWSRGGDAIVVKPGLNTVADLKNKTVACAEGSPSQTFLLWMLKANEMKMEDIKLIKVANGIDAAAAFKAGKVDAAVCWAPDDQDCIKAIAGSKVLISTKQASNIIADAVYVKKDFLDRYPKTMEALVKGWLSANAMINTSEPAKKEAAKLFAAGFNVPEDFAYEGIGNARLCTYGDNANFFGLNTQFTGTTGDSMYSEMAIAYNSAGLAEDNIPMWRQISDTSTLVNLGPLMGGASQAAEGKAKFVPVDNASKLQTISSKKLSITFATGSSVLDGNAQTIIQMGFGSFIKSFAQSRVRIEGNTDSIGSDSINQALSEQRARSVADYLTKTYKLDPNRIVVVGNGPRKPVADNATEEGRAANRRTDFELVQ